MEVVVTEVAAMEVAAITAAVAGEVMEAAAITAAAAGEVMEAAVITAADGEATEAAAITAVIMVGTAIGVAMGAGTSATAIPIMAVTLTQDGMITATTPIRVMVGHLTTVMAIRPLPMATPTHHMATTMATTAITAIQRPAPSEADWQEPQLVPR